MKLIKRITADIRGPGLPNDAAEMIVNEKLLKLQTDNDGERNDIIIEDIKEVNKDSGISVFLVTYENKSLDIKKAVKKDADAKIDAKKSV